MLIEDASGFLFVRRRAELGDPGGAPFGDHADDAHQVLPVLGQGILYMGRHFEKIDPPDDAVSFQFAQLLGEDGLGTVGKIFLDGAEAVLSRTDLVDDHQLPFAEDHRLRGGQRADPEKGDIGTVGHVFRFLSDKVASLAVIKICWFVLILIKKIVLVNIKIHANM